MASQTEDHKVGTEETKNIDKDLHKDNMPVEEDNKSQDETATNEQTITKQTCTGNTTECQNESEDSEEAEFEIIGTDVLACSKEALLKTHEDIKREAVEPVGPIVNIVPNNAETNAEEKLLHNETCSIEDNVADKESLDASLIDIKVNKESEDKSNKDVPESEAQQSEELEISSSLSKEILPESHEEREETKAEESQDKGLIDITIIDDSKKDSFVKDTIKEADSSFEAEVIEDDADIQVVPSDGEDVIEYTIEAGDVLPFLTILVAVVAIVMGLVYYYNNSDNTVVTDDVLEEQEEEKRKGKLYGFN